jgi:hypothetical protein
MAARKRRRTPGEVKNRGAHRRVDDAAWIREHFEELVERYASQYAVVAGGELFVGYDPVPLERQARHKHPATIPSVLRVPRPEDFTYAL